MKTRLRNLVLASTQFIALFISFPAMAASIGQLTIVGDANQPGISGNYSTTANFSWMSQIFPGNTAGFSWSLGSGSDNGILFGQAQNAGEMLSIRPMFNQPTTFYSEGSGLTIDNLNVIDMSNLRMQHASTIIDVGSGSGFNTLVNRVSDITLLTQGENGWMLNQDGSYYLIYNTRGTCDSCNLALHLYGTAVVPVPPAILLFCSGLMSFAIMRRRQKQAF